MSRLRKRICVIGLVLAGGAGLMACGDTVATDFIEVTIDSDYYTQNFTPLARISCETPEHEVGAQFVCKGRNKKGVDLVIGGKLTNLDDGGELPTFKWVVLRSSVAGDTFAKSALKVLNKDRDTVDSMVCPKVIELQADAVVTCTATMNDGTERTAEMTLLGNAGFFRASLHSPDPPS